MTTATTTEAIAPAQPKRVPTPDAITPKRLTIDEASRALRLSRASLYKRVSAGSIRLMKDGKRSYVTPAEIDRYVASCESAL